MSSRIIECKRRRHYAEGRTTFSSARMSRTARRTVPERTPSPAVSTVPSRITTKKLLDSPMWQCREGRAPGRVEASHE